MLSRKHNVLKRYDVICTKVIITRISETDPVHRTMSGPSYPSGLSSSTLKRMKYSFVSTGLVKYSLGSNMKFSVKPCHVSIQQFE